MRHRKRRALSWVGSIVLAALLLVPLALRGHHHDGGPANRACATCVAVQHTPAVHVPPLGLDAPAFRASSFPRATPRVVARLGGSPAHGRAPPRDPSRAA
jgi:hypothetical protein